MSDRRLLDVIRKYERHPEFLGLKIESPNQRGALDSTLLHIATETGATEDMAVLLGAGADVNAQGDLGNTPLHAGAMKGQVTAVRLLLDHGADPAILNEHGQTALKVAELGGHQAVVDILRGAK